MIKNKNWAKKIKIPKLRMDPDQIKKKWKHAIEFGIEGHWNPRNSPKFEKVIIEHVKNATEIFKSTYRGQQVFVFLEKEK